MTGSVTQELPRIPVHGEGMVVLVDDEEVMLVTGEAMLRDFGYDVLLARNGAEAVEMYRDHHADIDLVVVDMIMPEMNGREAFAQMRAINPDARIVLSSGFSREEDLNDIKQQGLSGFIQKPFRSSELTNILSDLQQD